MAHYEPPHQDLLCLKIQLFSSLVLKELDPVFSFILGSLTTADKELIILATSIENKCSCCIVIHGAFHRVCSKNSRLADQVKQMQGDLVINSEKI